MQDCLDVIAEPTESPCGGRTIDQDTNLEKHRPSNFEGGPPSMTETPNLIYEGSSPKWRRGNTTQENQHSNDGRKQGTRVRFLPRAPVKLTRVDLTINARIFAVLDDGCHRTWSHSCLRRALGKRPQETRSERTPSLLGDCGLCGHRQTKRSLRSRFL